MYGIFVQAHLNMTIEKYDITILIKDSIKINNSANIYSCHKNTHFSKSEFVPCSHNIPLEKS